MLSGDALMELVSSNAQMDSMLSKENPITEEVITVEVGVTAGVEIPAGIYDLELTEGYGSFHVEIYRDGEVLDEKYLWLDVDDEVENSYKNLVFPEGAKITWDEYETVSLTFTPSPQIKDTDYLGYYGR